MEIWNCSSSTKDEKIQEQLQPVELDQLTGACERRVLVTVLRRSCSSISSNSCQPRPFSALPLPYLYSTCTSALPFQYRFNTVSVLQFDFFVLRASASILVFDFFVLPCFRFAQYFYSTFVVLPYVVGASLRCHVVEAEWRKEDKGRE